MGIDPKAKSMSDANGKRSSAMAEMREGPSLAVTPEQLHCAVRVVYEFISEVVDRNQGKERPKVSLAWLGDGQWVASVVWWPERKQVTAWSYEPAKALYKLAERLCEGGDPWRPMKDKT